MTDVVPELLEKIQTDFSERFKNSAVIKKLSGLIDSGKATYKEANEYATEAGRLLSESFKKYLSSDTLPDGKMYYNIAERILNPTLSNNHSLISKATAQIQTEINADAGIGIKGVEPPLNQDRIDGLVNKVSGADEYDDVAWALDEPIVNFSQSVVDDTVRSNADFHYEAGLSPKIVRKLAGKCCKWCRSLAGTYDYHDAPDQVYMRHRYCDCIIEYNPGDGSKQNVHTRKISSSGKDKEMRIRQSERWAEEQEEEKKNRRISVDTTFKPVPSEPYVKEAIAKGEIKDEINPEKQNRHLEGTSNGKSYIYGGQEEASALYNELSGTGEAIMNRKGVWTKKERAQVSNVIGVHSDSNSKETESSTAIITYSKTGSHIYPGKDEGNDT